MSESARREVTVLVYPGMQLLDVVGLAEVFQSAALHTGSQAYQLSYVSPETLSDTSAGLTLQAAPLASAPRTIHTLVVPGARAQPLVRILGDEATMRWLASAAGRASRVASICSGAFLLAKAGLLDGRRATTHWFGAQQLAAAFATEAEAA